MSAADIADANIDAWVAEVDNPAWFSLELRFQADRFELHLATPDSALEVAESGTYTFDGAELVVSLGGRGSGDTYTFAIEQSGEGLALNWLSSTEEGSGEDKEHHRRYTIAFYCSAVFHRTSG